MTDAKRAAPVERDPLHLNHDHWSSDSSPVIGNQHHRYPGEDAAEACARPWLAAGREVGVTPLCANRGEILCIVVRAFGEPAGVPRREPPIIGDLKRASYQQRARGGAAYRGAGQP
jgi:hypothetical protein